MNTLTKSIVKRVTTVVASVLLTAALVGLLAPVAPAGAEETPTSDRASFQSQTARTTQAPGSPVGPPVKILVCHKCRTRPVSQNALEAHLKHGDYQGPCKPPCK